MSENKPKTEREIRILSNLSTNDFVGRQHELEKILSHARQNTAKSGLLILSAPLAGASELLKQVYDRLFVERQNSIPIYFAFSKNDKSPEETARRFLQTFLLQTVAFRRNDPKLLHSAPELSEIAELAAPSDGYWIDRLIMACDDEVKGDDARAFVRQVFSAPLRALSHGAQSFLIFDDFHEAEPSLIEEIKQIYSRAIVPFIIAGRRRYLLNALQNGENGLHNTGFIHLSPLSVAEASILADKTASEYKVKLSEQVRDLMIQQLECNPVFITNLILGARDRQTDLDSFQRCQQVYTAELLGGRIGRYFSGIFDEIAPQHELQRELLSLLQNALASEQSKSTIETWGNRVSVNQEDFLRLIRELHQYEIIRSDSSLVEVPEIAIVIRDYISARYSLEVETQPRALVIAETLAKVLKRAPRLMARFYRRTASLGLRDVLATFNLQEVPAVLFDYARYRKFYKGADDAEIETNLANEKEKVILPQIVYVANCAEFYPSIERISDAERSAVAVGFEKGNYSDENQIYWIAAEIESKLEASLETTEFWLDRLEAVAVFCNFNRVRLWLVAPEGFTEEAQQLLNDRGAFSSSRKQFELFADILHAQNSSTEEATGEEYQLIMPMGDDTELISAQAVEEIARHHDFKPAAINQIKTALIEACINASEHSLSPERRIYQKFVFERDKLVITVSNRGLQIPFGKQNGSAAEENPAGRRGFGLRLIRSLMDAVEFLNSDDGTQIRMTKLLNG